MLFKIACLFLTIASSFLLSGLTGIHEARSQRISIEQQRVFLVERLSERLQTIETSLEQLESGVHKAELESGTPENTPSILMALTREGSVLAPRLLQIYRLKVFDESRLVQQQAIDCIYTIANKVFIYEKGKLLNAIPTLASLSPDLLTKTVSDALRFTDADIGELSGGYVFDCTELSGGPGEGLLAPDTIVSLSWDSQCLINRELPEGMPLRPTVGSLLYDRGDGFGDEAYCSGTLIAPNLVLTAAHCFCQTGARQQGGRFYTTARSCLKGLMRRDGRAFRPTDPRNLSVFFQHAGKRKARSIQIHPQFRWGAFSPFADLAVVELAKPIHAFAPSPINSVGRVRPGQRGQASGYGYYRPITDSGAVSGSTELVRKSGLKFDGDVVTGRCGRSQGSRGLICWKRRERQNELFLGSTCNGDSGGAIFAQHQQKEYLIGVVSAGEKRCAIGSRTWNMSTFSFRRWINAKLRDYGNDPRNLPTASSANQRICVTCKGCLTNEKDNEYEPGVSDTPYVVAINGDTTKSVQVSANCAALAYIEEATLSVVRLEEKEQDDPGATRDEAVELLKESNTGTAFSIRVPAKKGDRLRVEFAKASTRECQIVVSELGVR